MRITILRVLGYGSLLATFILCAVAFGNALEYPLMPIPWLLLLGYLTSGIITCAVLTTLADMAEKINILFEEAGEKLEPTEERRTLPGSAAQA